MLAALLIVFLHVPSDKLDPADSIFLVRAAARWCVPFFFVTMGMLIKTGADGKPDIGLQRILRLSAIYVVSWLIYLPVAIYDGGHGMPSMGTDILVVGTNFHLWFLSASVSALVTIMVFYRAGIERLLLPVGIVLLSLWWFAEFERSLTDGTSYPWAAVARELAAIPLICLGMGVRRYAPRVSARASGALLAAAIVAYAAELVVMTSHGLLIGFPQIFGGALLVALFLPIFAMRMPDIVSARFGTIAAAIALPIYILHPLVLRLIDTAARVAKLSPGSILLGSAGAVGTLVLALLIRQFAPPVQRALEGNWTIGAMRR